MINKISTISKKTGKEVFIYKYEDGKFASRALYEEQQKVKPKRKKKVPIVQPVIQEEDLNPVFVETIKTIEDNLTKQEVKEGTQIVELGSDFDVDKEWQAEVGTFNKDVVEFEQSIEKAFEEPTVEIPQDKVIQEKLKEPVKGFFSTWFSWWNW